MLVLKMIESLRLAIGLLACLASASALPALFPRENITTYKYYAEVQSESLSPTTWASQFVISGLMHVTPDTSNPNLKNAYYVSLDVTHGIQNGQINITEKLEGHKLQPIPDVAKAVKDPFVVVFHDNGKVEGLIVNANEPQWSENIKKSIASMLQLDLSSILIQTPMGAQIFSSNESTLYGECTVDYNISASEQGDKMFVVEKFIEPAKCTKFIMHTFDSEESVRHFEKEGKNVSVSSERIFNIENNGEYLLIKKLAAHGLFKYSPWRDDSTTHYVLAGQTIEFESSVPVGSKTLPTLNTEKTFILNDMTFQKPQSKCADKAGVDFTYGRHIVDAEALVQKLVIMLGEAVDYLEENHWETTAPDLKHGQTISRILDTLRCAGITSLENVANRITDETDQKKVSMTKIFLQVLPYVGTEATSLYIEQIIRNHAIPDSTAIGILTKFPFYVRDPTEELLVEMEGLTSLGDKVSSGVRKAGILGFATLINKAHRHEKYHGTLNPELVSRYVNQYFGHVMNETSYPIKILYIQALKNIGTSDVFRLLKPIVSGEVVLPEKPQHLRIMAMYAFEGADQSDADIDGLFWPILENKQLALEIRVTAMKILFKQEPQVERFTRLVTFMENEKNKHLYNYYYTMLESFAYSSSYYMTPFKEIAKTVLESGVKRPASTDLLTFVGHMAYENEEFEFGESWTFNFVADEYTGSPFFGVVEYSTSNSEKYVDQVTILLRAEGFDDFLGTLSWDISIDNLALPIEKIENLLKKASEDMPGQKPIHVELAIMHQGRFVMSEYYDKESLPESMSTVVMGFIGFLLEDRKIFETHDFTFIEVVSNDLGLPTVFETRMPRVFSAQKKIVRIPQGLKVEIGAKHWSHSYQALEVYNPIIDTWHAIRRVSAFDASLPFTMGIQSHDNMKRFTLTLPILAATQYSVPYTRIYNKNYVMVIGAEEDVFEQYCSNCNMTALISGGEERYNETTSFDSIDTGLKITHQQFDCDTDELQGMSLSILSRIFDDDDDDDKLQLDDLVVLGFMAFRERQLHKITEARSRGCGYLNKIEPSHVYPTSEIEFNIFFDTSTALPMKLSLPPAMNVNFNVSVVVKAATTNAHVSSWTVTGFWNSTEGYLRNDMQLDITRSTAEDEDFKVCIDAHKTYPMTVSDPFDRAVKLDGKTTGQFRVLMGKTATEACPSEGISLRIEMEGKVSDEQKEALKHGKIHDACQRDIDNPVYMYAESSIVPRTPACLREALLRTTLRQYFYHVFYQNMPELVEEIFTWVDDQFNEEGSNNYTSPTAGRTEPGNVEVILEFPLNTTGFNLNLRTPSHHTQHTDLLSDDLEGWDELLDNTYFSLDVLESIRDENDKFCSIYPDILMNADGAFTPYTVPGQWTLVTGDYTYHQFSVFVKRIEPKKLGLLLSVSNHTIEVIPTATNPTVTVDGNSISYENDLIVPKNEDEDDEDSLAYRIVWSPNPKRFRIETTFSAFSLEWTERSVSLLMSSDIRGQVTGLCGHLDGTYKEGLAKVYTIIE